jgi:TPR repeat protein
MKRILTALVLLTGLFGAGGAVWGGDYDKGMKAYRSNDDATALKEWRPLAEQGHAEAQFRLGWMYDNGRGVTQDYAEAVKWYRKSAEQGHAEAQYWLGSLYGVGLGVLQDLIAAHMWNSIAAANGDTAGGERRENIAGKLSPSELAEARKRAKRCMESKYKDCEAEPKSWWQKLLD